MEALRVVLVEAQNPANVGFVARVLANFGVEEWVLVGGVEWRGSEAERTGAPAKATLEKARRVERLEEAVADCSHLIGFTARAGRHRRPSSLTAIGELRRQWGAAARVALLFGREDRGLEDQEAERCTALLTIPSRGFASFNLSHAVAIALYEWFRDEAGLPRDYQEICWASDADRARLLAKAREAIARTDFPFEPEHLAGTLGRLQALPLEARDLRMLEKILRHVAWLRDPPGPTHRSAPTSARDDGPTHRSAPTSARNDEPP